MSSNPVSAIPAAEPAIAQAHFARRLALETDCSDVHAALTANCADPGFVLVDVRGPNAYRRGHAPGALNIPHGTMTAERMAEWPAETLFVVYCAGPHCNGADRAALRLSSLGRPVKLMIGGVTGWADEEFALAVGDQPGALASARSAA